MTFELFEDKQSGLYYIKDGEGTLKLSKEQFDAMKKDGRSPLLKKLWDQAKAERAAMKSTVEPQTKLK